MEKLRIGELAFITGVSTRSLRYYEGQRLLHAGRTAGGHRTYSPESVVRVAWIQRFFAAGLCSSKIADLLPFVDGCSPETDTASPGEKLQSLLEVELHRLDTAIRQITISRAELARIIAETQPQRRES
ncbi:MerR family transcriptional regulator [Paenarthrobacter sp. NPDC057981]|uniref:MerR family transcriptional regulator n=1 Tax=Paenarthrobacter sp. NPDC057981 TaxID=3346297 RepID=UPI0036DA5A66